MTVAYTNAWCYVEFVPRTGAGDPFVVNTTTFPFLTGASVTMNLGMVTEVSVNLDLPFDTGIKFLNNEIAEGVLFAGTFLKIRMGYGDPTDATNSIVSPTFIGFMSKGGVGIVLSPNGVSGTITATGIGPQAARSMPSASPTMLQEFEKRLQLIGLGSDRIRNGENLSPINPRTGLPVLVTLDVTKEARKSFDELMLRPLSDFDFGALSIDHKTFIDRVLEKGSLVGGWAHYADVSIFGVFPEVLGVSTLMSKYVFVMRGGFDYNAQGLITTYPIISFSVSQSAVLFYAGADPSEISAIMSDVDRSGNVQKAAATSADSEAVPTIKNEGNVPNPTDTQAQSVETNRALVPKEYGVQVEVAKPETPNLAESLINDVRAQMTRFVPGIEATLVTFGIPDITAGSYVRVEGVGVMHTGIYSVQGVTHTWSGADIETSLTLRATTNDNELPLVRVTFEPTAEGTP